MNKGNEFIQFTYWNEVYPLIWNNLKALIIKKAKTLDLMNQWFVKTDFTTIDPELYKKKLYTYRLLKAEVNLLQAAWNMIPEYKTVCDNYVFWIANSRDAIKQELIREVIRLREVTNGK